jgi:hypothetical protein
VIWGLRYRLARFFVMREPQESKTKKHGRFKKLLLILAGFVVLTIAGGKIWLHYKFPYGYSHACSKLLGMALRLYAEDHDGWLPHGGRTPEVSLALFAEDDMIDARLVLGGKTVPGEVVQAALTNQGSFGPATCGWHYIEGLREGDDPGIAVAWDKVTGLGHNGERRPRLMHEVVFLDASTQFITQSRWTEFVAEQRQKLEKVIASRESHAPPIRWSDEATLGTNRFTALRN